MSTKKKPDTKIIEMPTDDLQAEAPAKMNWPEATERKYLRCDLDNNNRLAYCAESAELVEKISQLEDQKKASASQYKAAMEEKQARLCRISGYVRSGWEEREVPCHWEFECSGVDAVSGERIFHPEKKALIRDDTGEVVEVRDITDAERQMSLPIEDETEADDGDE